jgi:MoxR-like ATPase
MHINIDYPDAGAEKTILALARDEFAGQIRKVDQEISQQQIFAARQAVMSVHMSEAVEDYLVQLVLATRKPEGYEAALGDWLSYGGSPRATIALDRCARAHAWLNGRDYVSPDDVQAVVHDCLRHRIILSFEAEAEGVNTDRAIDRLLDLVPVV